MEINKEQFMKLESFQNIFLVDDQKTQITISTSGITLCQDFLVGEGENSIKKGSQYVPFQNIISTSCEETEQISKSMQIFEMFKTSADLFEILPEPLEMCDYADSKLNSLAIHFVKEEKEEGILKLKKVVLHHSNYNLISRWCSFLKGIINTYKRRPKHLLVFVNPFGGKGRGKKMWEEKMFDLFKVACVKCKVITTERANYALDLLQTMDLKRFDGIISVGGDGMFAEVFNGLLLRTSKDANLNENDKETIFLKPDIRVGFIPGGSTDTVSMSLHGSIDPVTAALHIVLGDRLDVDVVSIHSKQRLERFVMSMLSYGYLGDLMKHSEGLRWLGRQRYDVSGVKTFLNLQAYEGTVRYSSNNAPEDCLLKEKCGEGCNICEKEENVDAKEVTERKISSISGKFLAVTSVNLACSSSHSKQGLSPSAHRGNGATDLILVHNTSRLNYFRYLFRTAFHTAHPFTLPFVQAVRVTDWEFAPHVGSTEPSIWNCDGEILEDPEIFVKAHRQLVPVFAR